jgi:hypothetical protein
MIADQKIGKSYFTAKDAKGKKLNHKGHEGTQKGNRRIARDQVIWLSEN